MAALLDIVIPSYQNPQQLLSCLNSFGLTLVYPARELVNIVVVNNGHEGLTEMLKDSKLVTVLEPGKNLGWEGGLKYALERTSAPFVCFSNDDIRLIPGDKMWFFKMMSLFNDPHVGAVGPSSNYVMGPQNFFTDEESRFLDVKYLIGFFMIVRREALDKAGGVDDTLPGGDDIDLSIRLRDSGYKLVCRRDIFVFHHGSVTGNALHPGYWNSPQMQEKTNMALIKKHGMRKFYETMVLGWMQAQSYVDWKWGEKDTEGEMCAGYVRGDSVLELGCGGRKTVPHAVGIDLHGGGEHIPFVTSGKDSSKADLVGDVSTGLPVARLSQDTIIARHIFEHCQDPMGTLQVWNHALKIGGRLIIAVPNQELGNTIVLNPEHLLSFTPKSLRNLALAAGFKHEETKTDVNGISFVSCFSKSWEPCYFEVPNPTVAPKAARLEEEVAA